MNEEKLMKEIYNEVRTRIYSTNRYNIDDNIKYQETIYKLLENIKRNKKIIPYISPHKEKSITEIVNFILKHMVVK